MTDVRVSRVHVEALTQQSPPDVRVSRIHVEALTGLAPPDVRVSRVHVEALIATGIGVNAPLAGTGALSAVVVAAGAVLAPLSGTGVLSAAVEVVDTTPVPDFDYFTEVLVDEPWGYWRLGDDGTTVVDATYRRMADASGNARHGKLPAADTVFSEPGALPGDPDTAVTFTSDGVLRGLVDMAAAGWTSPAAFTIETWARGGIASGHRAVVGHGSDAYAPWVLTHWPVFLDAGEVSFSATATSTGRTTQTLTVDISDDGELDAWHHLVGTWDGATLRLYVNGALVDSGPLSGVLDADTVQWPDLNIGAGRGGNVYPGTIDEVALYRHELSAARVAAHYAAAPVRVPLAAALAGAGALSAQVVAVVTVEAEPLTGSGTLAASTIPTVDVTGALTGSGALSAAVLEVGGDYFSQVAYDQPWGYWRYGDANSDRVPDHSGHRRRGIPVSGNLPTFLAGALPNDPDRALETDQAHAVDPADWAPTSTLTVSTWMHGAGESGSPVGMVGMGRGADATWGLARGDGEASFTVVTDAGTVTLTAATSNDWRLVVGTYDGATMRLYVNGTEAATAPQSGVPANADQIYLAAGPGPTPTAGAIDETTLFRTVLPTDRIAAHWAARDVAGPPRPLAELAGVGTLTADVLVLVTTVPPVPAAPNAGRTRVGTATATWNPPVVAPPATTAPVHARISAHAYTSVTMSGTRPVLEGLQTSERRRQRDRIVIAGRDVTYWRGIETPGPQFDLQEPLLWGGATIELPQVAACFEAPGRGGLSWLTKGVPVLIQRVNPDTGEVVATDYKGIVLDFDISGRSLSVTAGGDAFGRAMLRDKQVPLFRRRQDLGWWWWNALAGPDGLDRPFWHVGGPDTGVKLYDTGGLGFGDYLRELGAKGVNLDGTQWTCTPFEAGPNAGVYRVHRKDTVTVAATIYLDDAHAVADLKSSAAEQPNRLYGTGVTPRGERAKFGVYPALSVPTMPRFPNFDGRAMNLGDTNADTDTGGGITALLHRLSVTGYLAAVDFAGSYDRDVVDAVRDLQDDARLLDTGQVNLETWQALYDVDVVGYSVRGARVEPIVQAPRVRKLRRNASGQVVGRNPDYDPHALVVDRTIDHGTGVTRAQMRKRSRAKLHQGRQWTGTIRLELGAVIAGEHTPGDPLDSSDLMHARALRPGDNVWLPLFDGGTFLHVSGIGIAAGNGVVTLAVDTQARDDMEVWEIVDRNQENRRNPARAWIRDHRSSSFIKDAVTEFDEIGGTITDTDLAAGWNVFPVVAGQEGDIGRIRTRLDKPAEYCLAVFGSRIAPKRLTRLIGDPLSHAGAKRWADPDRLDKLVGDHVLLYTAGDDQAPCGYYPGTKETRTYTPQIPNPDYNIDVAPDHEKFDNRETLNQQVLNPNYDPTDPDNDQEYIDKVVTEVTTPVTGRWDDDGGFPYRTFGSERGGAIAESGCVLWVAIYVRHPGRTLQGGRIMWPQLEAGA